MAERYLEISNYRNVGFSNEQRILLNTSIKKGELGGVVVVVGPNNSGKSNCLDALLSLSKDHNLSKKDIADFLRDPKYPKISLYIKDENVEVGVFKKLNGDKETTESYYQEKGQARKTEVESTVTLSKGAKEFALRMVTQTPLMIKTPIILTEDQKKFGIAVIKLIASTEYLGGDPMRKINPSVYDWVRGNQEKLWENRQDIFPKCIDLLVNSLGVKWYNQLMAPFNKITEDELNNYNLALFNNTRSTNANLSQGSLNLIKSLSEKSTGSKKKPISQRSQLIAQTLISSAYKLDIEQSNQRKIDHISSEKLIEVIKKFYKDHVLPEEGVYDTLLEANTIMIRLKGIRYHSSLNFSKPELDACLKEYRKYEDIVQNINFDFKNYEQEIQEIYKHLQSVWGKDFYKTKFKMTESKPDIDRYMDELTTQNLVKSSPEIAKWEKDNHLMIQPNIIRFAETTISQSSLTDKPSTLKKSEFFNVLFKAIGYDINSLIGLYEDVKSESKVTRILRTSESELNKRLLAITDQFNRLFFQSKETYEFKFLLESEKIEFSISVGDLPLNLDKQSTGFRWFFNFYFTIVAQKGLRRGDIVIMDEPATNLHVSGIQELRHFIKEYAKRSELTFVISTHSPFMIDIDHLEEIRVVNRTNGEAIVNNKFQVIQDDDTDALRPVKDALTVGRHILINPTKKTIFVEGITDYCYLTAFKKVFPEGKGLYFLPIQGLKKENIIDKILKIDKTPTILVDSDHYGSGTKKLAESPHYKNKVEVIKLDEIDQSFVDIESLFAAVDRPIKKSFNDAVSFKNRMNLDDLDPKTHQNFKKIFENISL
jgi:energy-coupling factor transporter ATP-binding protein EcfA2